MDFLEELEWRGLIKDISNRDKIKQMNNGEVAVYCGFDPTAPSLHVGHLILITLLERFRRFGFVPIALVGGSTGMVGDPSFKRIERIMLNMDQVQENTRSISKQISKLVPDVQIMNNKEWLGSLSLVEYLRKIAKRFNVAYLLSKDTIMNRITSGLSITEFLYPTLQAYDFLWLYENKNCYIQLGGSDQWGNITTGLDLITSLYRTESMAVGLTTPLFLKKNGEKFGKTARGGTIWLDSQKTTSYEFYQFWMSQSDEDAKKEIKLLTFMTRKQISRLISSHTKNPKKRLLQKRLAKEMTIFVHGIKSCQKARKLSNLLFNYPTKSTISEDKIWKELSKASIKKEFHGHRSVLSALRSSGVTDSLRETQEFIRDKAIKINGVVVSDFRQPLSDFKNPNSDLLLVKKGKRHYFIWRIVDCQI